jgi:hypothetical protein
MFFGLFENLQNIAGHLSPQRECLIKAALFCHEIVLDWEGFMFGRRQLCEIGLPILTRVQRSAMTN